MDENLHVVENATCTFCGCVCDDQILTVDRDEKRITKVQEHLRPGARLVHRARP